MHYFNNGVKELYLKQSKYKDVNEKVKMVSEGYSS